MASHDARSAAVSSFQTSIFTLGVAGFAALVCILGGGAAQGRGSDLVLQIAAIPVLLFGLLRLPRRGGRQSWALLLIICGLLLVVFQLIPLPPDAWSRLPGRGVIVEQLRAAGVALPWMPVSLDPESSRRALFGLLPALAIFIAALSLDDSARRVIALGLVGFALLSIVLGLAQIAGGRLLLYSDSSPDSVGFFANRNHYAAFLYCAIPFTAVWLGHGLRLGGTARAFWTTVAVLVLIALILGIAMSRSRAGLALGVGAGAGSLLLVRRRGSGFVQSTRSILGLALALGIGFGIYYGIDRLLGRFEFQATQDDLRFELTGTTMEAAARFSPIGSGLGTFELIYPEFEAPTDLIYPIINHAHNEYAELWLEAGWPAAVIFAAFLVWYGLSSVLAWRGSREQSIWSDGLSRAASIVILALLLHSFVDYQLRTSVLMSVFAFCCVLLIPSPGSASSGGGSRRRRIPVGRASPVTERLAAGRG